MVELGRGVPVLARGWAQGGHSDRGWRDVGFALRVHKLHAAICINSFPNVNLSSQFDQIPFTAINLCVYNGGRF